MRLGLNVEQKTMLKESGYRKFENRKFELLADVGEIGPSYQPGHAHADTLSFVLYINGKAVIVDGGTSTYHSGALRLKERGTAAHNTVTVRNKNSSEVWSSFRVARRAKVKILRDEENILTAQHDGYRHLGAIHQRTWQVAEKQVVITDTLRGKLLEGKAHLHFAPQCVPQQKGNTIEMGNMSITFENANCIEVMPAQLPDGYNQFRKNYEATIEFKEQLKAILSIN